jgi:hypothetical protein
MIVMVPGVEVEPVALVTATAALITVKAVTVMIKEPCKCIREARGKFHDQGAKARRMLIGPRMEDLSSTTLERCTSTPPPFLKK